MFPTVNAYNDTPNSLVNAGDSANITPQVFAADPNDNADGNVYIPS
jgi:hypothetical protein